MCEVAVIDRVVDGERAVLLVGDPPGREEVVPLAELPADAREGDWLQVTLRDGEIVSATVDREATARARDRVRAKLEALRQRGRRPR